MFEKVCTILANFTEVEISQMTMETDLLKDLNLNSLDVMEAVIRFENEFHIEISDRQVWNFHTIGDIVSFISEKA